MRRAEELSASYGMTSVAVISGVGTREYYRKLGYSLHSTGKGYFMKKRLSSPLRSASSVKTVVQNYAVVIQTCILGLALLFLVSRKKF